MRRLIVALSRARLGLYIFCRVPLFQNCFELSNAFKILTKRPLNLQIVPDEDFSFKRNLNDNIEDKSVLSMEGMPQMVQFVYQFYQQKIEEWKRDKPEMFEQQRPEEAIPDEEPMEETAEQEKIEDDEEEEELGFEKLTEDDTGKEDIADEVIIGGDSDDENAVEKE